jgi:dolichol-phosphate mannosyltransferase
MPTRTEGAALRPLVILPMYNERENVRSIVSAVLQQGNFSALIVDDNSPDGTGEVAEELKREHPGRVDVLHRAGKLGLGTAYVAGFRWALARDFTHVHEMDADFSHPPEMLPRLLAAASQADLVLGSRRVPGGATPDWSLLRRAISAGGSIYARVILGLPIHDLTGGFKCFRREVLEALDFESVRSEGYLFQIEMTYRAIQLGFRVTEVPFVFMDRRVGKSKMSGRIVREAALGVWRLRFSPRAARQIAPLRVEG